jgi:hypothetical protein
MASQRPSLARCSKMFRSDDVMMVERIQMWDLPQPTSGGVKQTKLSVPCSEL